MHARAPNAPRRQAVKLLAGSALLPLFGGCGGAPTATPQGAYPGASLTEAMLSSSGADRSRVVSPWSALQFVTLMAPAMDPRAAADLLERQGLPPQANRALEAMAKPLPGMDSQRFIWTALGIDLHTSYSRDAIEQGKAKLGQFDPAQPEASAAKFNQQIAEATGNRIRDLMNAGDISPIARLVAAATVHFRLPWASPFDPARTRPGPFERSATEKLTLDFMHAVDIHPVADVAGWTLLRMRYSHEAIVLDLVLPPAGSSPAGATARLTSLNSLQPARINLALPRVRIEGERFSLMPMFERAGLGAMLKPLTGLLEKQEEVKLETVVQKAFIEWDETGTEAAAATAGVVVGKGAGPGPREITFNRPFAFFVRKAADGGILFAGQFHGS
jgi:serine protease inhibitor